MLLGDERTKLRLKYTSAKVLELVHCEAGRSAFVIRKNSYEESLMSGEKMKRRKGDRSEEKIYTSAKVFKLVPCKA